MANVFDSLFLSLLTHLSRSLLMTPAVVCSETGLLLCWFQVMPSWWIPNWRWIAFVLAWCWKSLNSHVCACNRRAVSHAAVHREWCPFRDPRNVRADKNPADTHAHLFSMTTNLKTAVHKNKVQLHNSLNACCAQDVHIMNQLNLDKDCINRMWEQWGKTVLVVSELTSTSKWQLQNKWKQWNHNLWSLMG